MLTCVSPNPWSEVFCRIDWEISSHQKTLSSKDCVGDTDVVYCCYNVGHIVAVIRCKQSELIAKNKGGSDNAQHKQKEM